MNLDERLEQVVLLDEQGRTTGSMDKLEVHRKGLLHRAFSIFLFNEAGHLLLQQRAATKYHSAALWTNTCCGHPRPGEIPEAAAKRRLFEELGIRCELDRKFEFLYQADVGNGLIEHELDAVYFGRFDGTVQADPSEVSATRWMRMNDLADDLSTSPQRYTEWLKVCWPRVLDFFRREQLRA